MMSHEFVRNTRIAKVSRELHIIENYPGDKEFIIWICSEFGCSSRTAKEYLKVARFKIKEDIENAN